LQKLANSFFSQLCFDGKFFESKQLLLEEKLARANRPNLRNELAMKNWTLSEPLMGEHTCWTFLRNLSR